MALNTVFWPLCVLATQMVHIWTYRQNTHTHFFFKNPTSSRLIKALAVWISILRSQKPKWNGENWMKLFVFFKWGRGTQWITVLAPQAWGPEFRSQNFVQCASFSGAHWLSAWLQVQGGTVLSQGNKAESDRKDPQHPPLTSACICVCESTHAHTHTQRM